MDMMLKIAKLCREEDYDNIIVKRCKKFSIHSFVKLILFLFSWFINVFKLPRYTINEKIIILTKCMEYYDIQRQINSVVCYNYHLCVLRYDSDSDQNFISQLFNSRKIQTVTLQHGVMLRSRPQLSNNIDFNGLEFRSFVSDYFIVWNTFTKNEAVKSGIEEKKIRVLGVAKCIGYDIIVPASNKIIGIILDGEYEKENNPLMISIVSKFCNKFGFKYIIRYHPDFHGNEYNEILDANGSVCKKSINLQNFLQNIELCIVANSTVLFELEYYKFPFLNFSTGSEKDKFKDYNSNKFYDYVSMTKAYNKIKVEHTSEEANGKFIADNYRNFFYSF